MTLEVRLDRMRPAELAAAMARAPVAWVPLGAIEFHAPHLPLGTDSLTASHVVVRAAEELGGVVLPHSTLTMGTLHLPWSLRYEAALVEAALRSTITQLAAFGARVVVIHTGHAPLDLLHLIKRVCHEVEGEIRVGDPAMYGFRAYGLCYLELNAALGAGLGSDWPVAVDHGSITETSWVMAIDPQLVDLDALAPELAGPIVGVYGPHPRGRASAELGGAQIGTCVTLLVQRVRTLLAGGRIDDMADLWTLVERYWPEEMAVGLQDPGTLLLHHAGPVSRYLTSLELRVDGIARDSAGLALANRTPGEAGVPIPVSSLGTEAGCYIRHGQHCELILDQPLTPGSHELTLELGLAGVALSTVVQQVVVEGP